LVVLIRESEGRRGETSMVIIDSQSVQNTESAEERGNDPHKKKVGIKRHIGVDTEGLPHALYVTTANVNDRVGAIELIEWNFANLTKVKKFLFDGGYDGAPFAAAVKEIHGADVEVVKRGDLPGFHVMPSGGSSSALSLGLTSIVVCGATVSASSLPLSKFSFLPLSLFLSRDFKRTLRIAPEAKNRNISYER